MVFPCSLSQPFSRFFGFLLPSMFGSIKNMIPQWQRNYSASIFQESFFFQVKYWTFQNVYIFIIFHFRASPNFNKEMYVDFIAAQIKTLSFLAYIIRIYQVKNPSSIKYASTMFRVPLLLSSCVVPPSVTTQLLGSGTALPLSWSYKATDQDPVISGLHHQYLSDKKTSSIITQIIICDPQNRFRFINREQILVFIHWVGFVDFQLSCDTQIMTLFIIYQEIWHSVIQTIQFYIDLQKNPEKCMIWSTKDSQIDCSGFCRSRSHLILMSNFRLILDCEFLIWTPYLSTGIGELLLSPDGERHAWFVCQLS